MDGKFPQNYLICFFLLWNRNASVEDHHSLNWPQFTRVLISELKSPGPFYLKAPCEPQMLPCWGQHLYRTTWAWQLCPPPPPSLFLPKKPLGSFWIDVVLEEINILFRDWDLCLLRKARNEVVTVDVFKIPNYRQQSKLWVVGGRGGRGWLVFK